MKGNVEHNIFAVGDHATLMPQEMPFKPDENARQPSGGIAVARLTTIAPNEHVMASPSGF